MTRAYDDAVVGAGILGLAHAYHLARRGRKVVVLERGPRAEGASVRNFGMLWPIGQPAGPSHRLALRSLALWHEVLVDAGLWHERLGSLHLAYRDDEARVLAEFAAAAPEAGYDCSLLGPSEVRGLAPMVRADGLLAGLFSPTETCVDPREVVAALPGYLAEKYGVRFEFGRAVVGYDRPYLLAPGGPAVEADRLYVCSGDEVRTLYPDAFRSAGLARCKLQMMRAAPPADGRRLGPMLAGGLTLRHYRSFERCPGLPALKARVAAETPEFDRLGIHVMASQNGRGELVVGDSHEYGDAITPFDRDEVERLILGYLRTFLDAPGLRVEARWNGIYVKHPSEPYCILRPEPGVAVVAGVGGAGMTLSFGLAERVVGESSEEV